MAAGGEDIEAHLRDHIDDQEIWLAYADWLVEHGDARGEAILLHDRLRRAELSEEERAALEQRYEALCAPERLLEDFEGRKDIEEAQWRHGFLLRARFGLVTTFERVCVHRVGALLIGATFATPLRLLQPREPRGLQGRDRGGGRPDRPGLPAHLLLGRQAP